MTSIFNNLYIGINRPTSYTRKNLETLLSSHGAIVVVPPDIPSVVVSSDNKQARSTKLFKLALSNELPVVSEDWADECIKTSSISPYEPFLLPKITYSPCSPTADVVHEHEPEVAEKPPIIVTPMARSHLSNILGSIKSMFKVYAKFVNTPMVVISTPEEYQRKKPLTVLTKAKANDLPIVSTDFLTECVKQSKVITDFDPFVLPMDSTEDQQIASFKKPLSPELIEKFQIDESNLEIEKLGKDQVISLDVLSPPTSPRIKPGSKVTVPVDPHCKVAGHCHVFVEDSIIWAVSLNQTDLIKNSNKFYIIQLLQDDFNPNSFFVFRKWGRVGAKSPAVALLKFSDLNLAKSEFVKRHKDKTGSSFPTTHYEHQSGKYYPVELDFTKSKGQTEEVMEEKKEERKNQEDEDGLMIRLPERLESFIHFIFNVDFYRQAELNMNYDRNRLPLGKLSPSQVKKGYIVLSKIQDYLNGRRSTESLEELTSTYFTLIPTDFGRNRPPVIQSQEQLRILLDNLANLSDMSVAEKLRNIAQSMCSSNVDQTVIQYRQLSTELIRVMPEDEVFSTISKYVTKNKGPTHRYGLKVLDLFKINRPSELERYNNCSIGNKTLLFHGSRVTNAPSILKNGLRIAPPEVPHQGYMFGKGIYLANMATKSANYCCPEETENGLEGTLYLVEAKLGKPAPLLDAQYLEEPLPGTQSTWGVGRTTPSKASHVVYNDVSVPIGEATQSTGHEGSCVLEYDEFIVYDLSQVLLKYVVRVLFE
ncbi:hypothetical protein P9112_012286 [Eukaryota sp. TZLM1-RC]